MTLKPDTEELLRKFLDGEWREELSAHELADQARETAAQLRHAELLGDRKAVSLRLDGLEERADAHSDRAAATGTHERQRLQGTIDAWKAWARGIAAVLITSAITALVLNYFTRR